MSHCWGYWCHLHATLSSARPDLSLVISHLVPRSLLQLGQHFFFVLLQELWCSCLSLSVCLPLFWHLHAVKDRQKTTTQALAATAKAQNALWWCVMQTSKRSKDHVHQSPQSLKSGSSIVGNSRDASNGPCLETCLETIGCWFNQLYFLPGDKVYCFTWYYDKFYITELWIQVQSTTCWLAVGWMSLLVHRCTGDDKYGFVV